jgi:hypothetical protein
LERGVDVGILANVEFECRDRCAAREDHAERAGQPAHLATNAQAFIERDRMFFEGDRFHRTYDCAGGIFAMAALDRHGAGWRVRDQQTRICLQAGFTVVFSASRYAGITSNTESGISNHEVVHVHFFHLLEKVPICENLHKYFIQHKQGFVIRIAQIFI